MEAVESGDLHKLLLLLAQGASPNCGNPSALLAAARLNDATLLEFLIQVCSPYSFHLPNRSGGDLTQTTHTHNRVAPIRRRSIRTAARWSTSQPNRATPSASCFSTDAARRSTQRITLASPLSTSLCNTRKRVRLYSACVCECGLAPLNVVWPCRVTDSVTLLRLALLSAEEQRGDFEATFAQAFQHFSEDLRRTPSLHLSFRHALQP